MVDASCTRVGPELNKRKRTGVNNEDVDAGKKWEAHGLLGNFHNLPCEDELAQVGRDCQSSPSSATSSNTKEGGHQERESRNIGHAWTARGHSGPLHAEYLLFSLQWTGTQLICPIRSKGGEGSFPSEPSVKARAFDTPPNRARERTSLRAAQEEDTHIAPFP